MMADIWKTLGQQVAKFAPLLGGAIGGPGGAAIGQLVASAFGAPADDPQAIAAAVQQDPQAAVKLRELELRHRERLEELALERYRAGLDAESERHAQSQQTIRAEAQYGTDYVKETRPRIARMSFYAGAAYALGMEAAKLAGLGAGADTALLGVLFGPVGFYMTMRTLDAFSGKGKS